MQDVSPHPSSTPGNSLTHTPKGACYVPYKIRPTVEINHHTEYIPNNGPCQAASISELFIWWSNKSSNKSGQEQHFWR